MEWDSLRCVKLPPEICDLLDRYDASSGSYFISPSGSQDGSHTEAPVALLLYALVRSVRPRTILETGVYHGLTTCFLAAGLRDNGLGGKVHGIDPNARAQPWLGSDLEEYIDLHRVGSVEALERIREICPQIDLLFIDSIHTYAHSSWELANYEPLVPSGGYIALHDALWHDVVGRTVQHLFDADRFETVVIDTPRTISSTSGEPISMGLAISRKVVCGPGFEQDPQWMEVRRSGPANVAPYIRDYSASRLKLEEGLKNRAAAQARTIVDLEQTIRNMEASVSWKLTRPLRELRKMISARAKR